MSTLFLMDLDFNSVGTVTGLRAPTAASDAATKAYVDALLQGLAWKDNCKVASQANVNVASPGSSIDSITLSAGDRVLLRAQTAGAENGIYIWNGAAVPMTRATDADAASELLSAVTTIDEGTSADVTYRLDTINITLGTTALSWVTFGTAAAAASETTAGIAEIATQAETDTGTDDLRIVTPAKLAAWSGRPRKHAADVGDGSNTSYTITHNFASRDVLVQVLRNSGNYDTVFCEVQRPTTNTVVLVFSAAPTTNQFRVVIHG